ncbi:MAG: SDR family oxidoreductase [Chloroflexi bacterium]|nr:SDR family oxidoreductase [Chloroflexota bacterium]
MGRLAEKVIVVTGASRGLGEAMARGFAREGAILTLAARSRDDLARVAAACRQAGAPAVLAMTVDVRQEEQLQQMVRETVQRFGKLNVLVVNAAVGPAVSGRRFTDLTSYDLATWQTILETNFTGAFLTLKAALPVMQEGGSVILVGSGTGRRASAGNAVYAISKAGVDVLTLIAAGEGRRRGIRVNCLAPGGMVDTQLFGPAGMPEHLKRLGHLPPEVMVEPAIFLASEESRGVTGGFFEAKRWDPAHPLAAATFPDPAAEFRAAWARRPATPSAS